jgi:hypothetical protein
MKGYLVPVHQLLDFPPGEEDVREVRIFGNQETISIPMGLNPPDDDVPLRRKAVMPPVQLHDLAVVHQGAKGLA